MQLYIQFVCDLILRQLTLIISSFNNNEQCNQGDLHAKNHA